MVNLKNLVTGRFKNKVTINSNAVTIREYVQIISTTKQDIKQN